MSCSKCGANTLRDAETGRFVSLSDAKGKHSKRKLAKWNEVYKTGIRNKKLELARWLDAHPEFKPKPRKRVKVVSKSAKFDTPCSRKPFNKCTATDYILSNGNQKTVINERVVKAKPVSKRKKKGA